MGSAGAGPSRRPRRILDQHVIVVRLGEHGARAVPVAELDRRLRYQRLQILLAELGRESEHVPRVRLFDRELGDRPAFRVVGVEQIGSRSAREHECELPGQIVPVLHAGVARRSRPSAACCERRRRRGRRARPGGAPPTPRTSSTAARSRSRLGSSGAPSASRTNSTQRSSEVSVPEVGRARRRPRRSPC